MSYLANINKLSSLVQTRKDLNSVAFNCINKSFSMPSQINLKSSYHLNTSKLSIPSTTVCKKINFNCCSIKNYTSRKCCVLSPISDIKYHELADEFFDNLSERIETILEDSKIENYDTELSSGVLTIKLGSAGTYVINKQTPNRQIWYSSPISGPRKYIYDIKTKRWVGLNECDSQEENRFIETRLSEELSQILKMKVDIPKMNEN
ncbi:Frataxin [Neocallimastix lanati (nom. inval.)]|jgi:frataxin|uniref:ferroxidase n=1 Tax=Neocallimastix californiae TaxID=1754190 RepID=A0A1Y2ETU5_9FUNG|nr:Frataxin [Neocallimastix sp. JGI-2020a]ORY74724.1 Frataxin [Neocallimastix californiae]|eukprot:ORY74724.1 Frataxin [Neocallimastix californiae]